MRKPTTRDPYLPSPEVCDWLLAQEWSKPATMHVSGPDCQSEIYECCRATAALGRNECIDLVLPADGIEMLREDQRQRAEAIDSSADPETVLLERILAEVAQTNLTAFQGIGILQTAATMMISQCYDLTNQGDQP